MNKSHIAIGVSDITRSVAYYSKRLGCAPEVVVQNEYALWRTDSVNFSIRRDTQNTGKLRHLGWEDSSATVRKRKIGVDHDCQQASMGDKVSRHFGQSEF